MQTGVSLGFRRKRKAQKHETQNEEKSELHYLISHLNEDLRKEVEECWIESNNLRIGHLLGNGEHFSLNIICPWFLCPVYL